jgi:hypothetical protein
MDNITRSKDAQNGEIFQVDLINPADGVRYANWLYHRKPSMTYPMDIPGI